MAEACGKQGMKLGFYYSQAQDWNNGGSVGLASWGDSAPPAWDKEQRQDTESYVRAVALPQIEELVTRYGPDVPSIIWWDTPRGMTKPLAKDIIDLVRRNKPDIIANNRLGGGVAGDTKTPEQYIPALGYPGEDWETCMTTNDSWGYQSWDDHWKSSGTLLRTLSDIVSKGGNFLLNVGPDAEGTIPAPSVRILQETGRWLALNGEAMYGTKASPFTYLSWGKATQKGNKLYLHVHKWPKNGLLKVPVDQKINRAYLLADRKTKLRYEIKDRYTTLRLPARCPDTAVTVLVLETDRPVASTLLDPIPSMHGKATASSFESEKYLPSNAVDFSTKTTWRAAKGERKGWLAVDLGRPCPIGHIALCEKRGHKGGNIRRFSLEYQQGDNWVPVLEGTDIGEEFQSSFGPIIAQRFRLNILDALSEPEIKDWQLFYEEE